MRTPVNKILIALMCSAAMLAGCSSSDDTPAPAPPGPDTTPDAFSFVDQTGVAANTVITSAAVTITGIDSPAAVTVAGADGSYSVGCTETFISTASTISNNQTVCVRHTSAATAGTATNTTLSVGGVSDIFTSTTAVASAAVRLLPFLKGTGELQLLDPGAALAAGTNPKTVDTGLTPPPPSACQSDLLTDDCFGKAQTFYTGTLTGTAVSDLHAARLAYINGGKVFKLNLAQSLETSAPVQISSLTNACRIVNAETTDLVAIDSSAVVIETAGVDTDCATAVDNAVTVIRLNSLTTDAGIVIALSRDAGNPLHALTDGAGAVIGYVSFEGSGVDSLLVRRDADLMNPVTLLALSPLNETSGSNIERADLTRVFVTATPSEQGLKLFRIESDGTLPSVALSPVLYSFGFNGGNPIQDGVHDATDLYFSDNNKVLRIPRDSTTENAVVIATMSCPESVPDVPDTCLRIGKRVLDTLTGFIVFEAAEQQDSVASGVFSAAINNANVAPAVTLANHPDALGGSAYLRVAANGVAYINITDHGSGLFPNDEDDALKVNTDGTNASTILSAYWAGTTLKTSFDLATEFAVPAQFIFLATRVVVEGVGADTLSVIDPATGSAVAGLGSLGTVGSAGDFQAVNINGLGRYALARAEIDRGARDNDVYFLDAMTAGSLTPLAQEPGATDMPVGN